MDSRDSGHASSFPSPTSTREDHLESIYPRGSALKAFRRRLLSPLYRISDTGICGLHPLRTHIVICGFGRSGTTLLQMMMENAMPHARRFGRETSAWRAATYAWRNHDVVISKMPKDLFAIDALRDFYARRGTRLRVILMCRDPRDILTSRHEQVSSEYCVKVEAWRRNYRAFLKHRNDPDVLIVRYEDLVADVAGWQERIENFTGERATRPFVDFYKEERPDFHQMTLNGLRPVEQSRIKRWSRPEYSDRIQQLLREIPEFPQALLDLRYEPDTRWADAYRREIRPQPTAVSA